MDEFVSETSVGLRDWGLRIVGQNRLRGGHAVFRDYGLRNHRLEDSVRECLPERIKNASPMAGLRLVLGDKDAGDFQLLVQLAPHFFGGGKKILQGLESEKLTRYWNENLVGSRKGVHGEKIEGRRTIRPALCHQLQSAVFVR